MTTSNVCQSLGYGGSVVSGDRRLEPLNSEDHACTYLGHHPGSIDKTRLC